MEKKKKGIINDFLTKPEKAAYLFLLPAALLIIVFNVIPLIASFVISTLDMGISFSSAEFIGIDNFKEAFQDSRFINSLKVTVTYTAIEVPIQMVIGLILSAFLTKNNMVNKIFRGDILLANCMFSNCSWYNVADYTSFKCRYGYILD